MDYRNRVTSSLFNICFNHYTGLCLSDMGVESFEYILLGIWKKSLGKCLLTNLSLALGLIAFEENYFYFNYKLWFPSSCKFILILLDSNIMLDLWEFWVEIAGLLYWNIYF